MYQGIGFLEIFDVQAIPLDVGEVDDIHPVNKKPVGERLAKQILNSCYGFSTYAPGGPIYKSHTTSGNTIRLAFSNVREGFRDTLAVLSWFTIAGRGQEILSSKYFR